MASAARDANSVRIDLHEITALAAAFWENVVLRGDAPDGESMFYYPVMAGWIDERHRGSWPQDADTIDMIGTLQHSLDHHLCERVGPEEHVTAEGPLGQFMHAARPAVRGDLTQVQSMTHSKELLQYCRAACAVTMPWTLAVLALLRNATPADVREARARLGRLPDGDTKTRLETQLRELAP
jgi:hypothetical protein